MNRLLALIFGLSTLWAAPMAAQADDQTLADIRQDLSVLYVEVQRLKRELSTTGASDAGNVGGSSSLERIDAIEAALQKLTAKSEQLENRINRVVADGTNRIGDLEFRLIELEGGDVSTLGETSTLGGGDARPAPVASPPSTVDTAELAVGERSDYQRAQAALASGDFRGAAAQFEAFTTTYPGGPMSADAHFLRGQAYENLGELASAARAYLESFSGTPDGARAPEALYKLGTSLGALGQQNEACVTLGEVGVRYPNSDMVFEAQSSMRNLGCS